MLVWYLYCINDTKFYKYGVSWKLTILTWVAKTGHMSLRDQVNCPIYYVLIVTQ